MRKMLEPAYSSQQARDCFKNLGFSYDDIKAGEIAALLILLGIEYKKSNAAGETSVYTYVSEKIDMKRKSNGGISECCLYVNSHYFTRRECISFNKDGFIGFAGWADDKNTNPITRAFVKWCHMMRKLKEETT